MIDLEFVLSRNQRNEIMKAIEAIGRQLKEMPSEPDWKARWVIATNLAIVQTNLTNLPVAGSH